MLNACSMKRPNLLISAAWLLYAVAWFLPVIKDGVTFPNGLPGWQAFRVAAGAVWPYGVEFNKWYDAILSTISAVTTPLFILGSVWAVSRGTRVWRRVFAWVATLAFLVNAYWFVFFGADRKDLRIGYFLWWLSFLVVALGFFKLSRQTTDNTSVPSTKLQVGSF